MISTTSAYKAAIDGNNREFTIKLVFDFTDGTSLTITDKTELMSPGISYDGASSDSSDFVIGSAIITKMNVYLNNSEGQYDDYTWKNATVSLYIGLVIDEDTTEVLRIGTYYVDKAVNGGVIKTINCLDALGLMDKDFANGTDGQTVYSAYSQACTTCGVVASQGTIEGGTLTIDTALEGVTCREVAGYAAQLSGGWVRATPTGYAEICHYDDEVCKTVSILRAKSVEDDDITITGIQANVTIDDEEVVYQAGEEGYMLSMESNPLITNEEAANYATTQALANLSSSFRPLSIETTLDPSLQPGDRIAVTDGKKTWYTYATQITWKLNNSMTIKCGAKTENDQNSERYDSLSKTIIKSIAASAADEKITAYDAAVSTLNTILANAMGFYQTDEEQDDGSTIRYLHNKPTLEESDVQFKISIDGFGFSTDYGVTWTSGWDSSGNAVFNILSAIGINADWINTGSLTVGGTSTNADGSIEVYDEDNNLICSIDKDGFYAILGTIAGWAISSTKLTSSNGQMIIDSANRRITCGDTDGTQARYSESGEGIWYDNEHLGDFGFMKIYWTDDDGNITSDLRGYVVGPKVWATDTCMGYGIVAWDSTAEMYQRQMFYDWQEEWFYFYKPVTVLALTESDPYYTKDITFDDDNQSFTMTVGRGATDDTTYDVTNTFVYSLDSDGNITAITNQTTGKTMTVNYK